MKSLRSLLLGFFLSTVLVSPVEAQISPDGTTDTIVTPIDNGFRIDEGDRAGDNLFHSFEGFSVPANTEVFFNNANDIVNIFSRVTGGDISNIDGLIRANSEANLFLINPAGIIFGEGAALDLGGSFFSSTTESIVFDDDVEFSATDRDNAPLLTVNMPIGLNFGNNPGDIAVNGSDLQVNNGETLALLGGNVTITGGQILAPGANIELGGLTETGQIGFTQLGNNFSLNFPETITRGDVTLTVGTEVNVRAAGGGSIEVNASNLELSGASNLFAGIASDSDSTEAQAGNITIDATEDITLAQESGIRNRVEESAKGNGGGIDITANNLFVSEKSQIDTNTAGRGNSGKIAINAADTVLLDGLRFDNFDPNIPPEERDLSGIGTIITQVEKSGVGNSGEIEITTTNLLLNNGAAISSDIVGRGNAGAITIEAFDTVAFEGVNQEPPNRGNFISSEVNFGATGNGGDINITTTNLSLKDGGVIASITSGQGNAGTITIKAFDTITLEGADRSEQILPSRIGTVVEPSATGNGGDINITTANLFLTDGALIDASTFGRGDAGTITIEAIDTITLEGANQVEPITSSLISTGVSLSATGNGGDINITTADLLLKDGALIDASTFGQGDAGTITIEAFDTISLEGTNSDGFGSLIASDTASSIDDNNLWQVAQGNAGTINLTTNNLFLKEGGQISTFTVAQGDAGAITIEVADTIFIEGKASGSASGIFSNAEPITEDLEAEFPETIPVGNAGDIKITTTSLFLNNGGQVETSSFIEGNAGTITVNASDLISIDGETSVGQNSSIYSGVASGRGSTGTGDSGKIDITTTNLSLTRGGLINVSNFALGDAGEINIDVADTITIDGESPDGTNSGIYSTVGNSAQGNGGRIEITSTNLSLTNGGLVSATTSGLGNAGEITIDVADTIAIDGESPDGSDSGIYSTVGSSAEGNANDINIRTSNLSLTNNAEISVASLGQGEAGNLFIEANSLSLTNNAALFASTPIGTGGNINLQIAEELILRDNSTISAEALEDANGGNLTINAQTIVAFPNQNNDIIANAARGTGGNIDITTNALFGIIERSSTPPNNTNDLDASSEFGLDGTVAINELDVNPAEELEELPAEVIDATRLVDQNLCQQGDQSEFIVTGKGGIAPNPSQVRDEEVSEVDLVEPVNHEAEEAEEALEAQTFLPTEEEIVEAQGWMVNDRGIVELVAHKTNTDSSPSQPKSNQICHN